MTSRLLSLAVVAAAGLATAGAGGTANVPIREASAQLGSAGVSAANRADAMLRQERISARVERLARIDRQEWTRTQRAAAQTRALRTHLAARSQPGPSRSLQAGAPPLCDGRRATIVGTNGDDTLTGTPGRDVIAALGGSDVVYGLGQNDLICAGGGDDWIWAGAGDDMIFGGEGNDFLIGGAGDDTMDGGGQPYDAAAFFDETGPVTASLVTGTASGEGADTFTNVAQLHGGDYADTLTGDAADNGLFGNGANDTVVGGDGNDLLSGGVGDDTIDGGAGDDDTVSYWDAGGPVTASLATGTSTGEGNDVFAGAEHLDGGPYGDTLTGGPGHDILAGEAGDDTLLGGDGNDFLIGGDGNDRLDGGPGDGDGLDGGPGDDTLDGGSGLYDGAVYYDVTGPITASLATGTATGQGFDTFQGVETIHGGPFDDTLSGGGDPNEFGLEGDDGNDTLNGGSTRDFLFGGNGNDTINGNDGNDFLVPGSGTDTLDGGPGDSDAVAYWDASGPITASLASGTASGDGADTFTNIEQIHGSPYGDNLSGGAQNGWLFGNDGADTISGGSGDEFLFGNGGDDTISGGPGDDFLAPGAGTDTLDGGPGFDKAAYWDSGGPITASLITESAAGDGPDTYSNLEGIHGGSYDDTLSGDPADNELFGNDGNDTLSGSGGNDSLNGWNGDDQLYGEAGNDYLDGWDGVDYADGGSEWDYCVNSETTYNCEQPPGSLLFDNFDDDSLDPAAWYPWTIGSGPGVSETGHQIRIDLPASSADNPGQGIFAAGISGTCPLRGDFDIQVDYSLPVWPPENGVRVGLATSYGNVERQSDPGSGDHYLVDFQGAVRGVTVTSDLAGTLRLQRQGSTLSGYYRSGNDWVLLASAQTSEGDAGYAIQAWSHDVLFADSDVAVTFDNFRMTQGTRIC